MSDRTDNSGAVVVILILAAIALSIVFWVSRTLGAHFGVTLKAMALSALCIIVYGAAKFMLHFRLMSSLPLLAASIFPCWWNVLNSMAMGGANPEEYQGMGYMFFTDTWYSSSWTKAIIELALIAGWLYMLKRDHYRY